MSGRQSFTLIELLVVVAIISLLAALLLPALRRAKEQGNRAVCMGHLKEVAVATLILADDNNGWINGINTPLTPAADTDVGATNYWDVTLIPYLGSDTLLRPGTPSCPGRPWQENGYTAFAPNTAFSGWGYAPMHSLKEVKHSSRIYLVAECSYVLPSSPTHFDYSALGNYEVRHMAEGLHFVFIDGHGEFFKCASENGSPDSRWWQGNYALDWWPYYGWSFGDYWGE